MSIPDQVEFIGAFAEAALREGRESELLVWVCARALLRSSGGSHVIPRRELVNAINEAGLFAKPGVRDLLLQGNGVFWRLGRRQVFLIGLANVAHALKIGTSGRWSQSVRVVDLKGHAILRGALLGVAVRDDKPIRQAAVRGGTQVSERSQRRYRRAGYLATRRQDGDLTQVAVRLTSHALRSRWAAQRAGAGFYMAGLAIRKRLPNLHCPLGERAHLPRHIRRMLRGQPSVYGVGDRDRPRVFFDNPGQWMRAHGPKLSVKEGERFIDGDTTVNVAWVRVRPDHWQAICHSERS